MTEVRLIRHGQIPLNNDRGVIAGRSVTQSLTELGEKQSLLLGEHYLASGVYPEAAYSSDTARNRQTGKLVLGICSPGLPISFADGLHEIALGAYEGMPRDDVYTPDIIRQINRELFDFKLPGTESMREVATRAKETMLTIGKRHPEQIVFAFTHYLTISCLVGLELGWSHFDIRNADIPNCSETKLYTDGDVLEIEYVGQSISVPDDPTHH